MPINCLIKFLINFWTVMFQKSIHGQFVNNSWTFMFQKDSPFLFSSLFLSLPLPSSLFLSLPLLVSSSLPLFSSLVLSRPLFLSFFNVRPVLSTNTLKTKDLRKRHFWLKILSQGKLLRLKTLGKKLPNDLFTSPPTLHSTRRPNLTLHTLPRNPTLCRLSCRICRPNPTHPTPLIIKS